MSIDVSFASTDVVKPEVVKEYLGVIRSTIKFAAGIAAITRSTRDDEVLAWLTTALDTIEPHADKQWVYDLINSVIGIFRKDGPEAAIDAVKASLSKFAG